MWKTNYLMNWGRVKFLLPGEDFRLVIQRDGGRQRRCLTGKPTLQAAPQLQRHEGHTSLVSYVGGHFSSLSLCGLLPHIELRIVWVSVHFNAWHCWLTLAGRKTELCKHFKSSCVSTISFSLMWRFMINDIFFLYSAFFFFFFFYTT